MYHIRYMLDPLDFENRPFLESLARRRRGAFFVLSIENIILHGWRFFFWVLLFLGLWMLEIPVFLGKTVSFLTSLCFFIGLFYFIKRDVLSFYFPNEREIDKALEKRSNLPQGHISLLDDILANPKKRETRTLWDFGQKNILHALNLLKTPRLKAILSRKDPTAIRFIAVLIFISGLMIAGSNWKSRIFDGLFPVSPSYMISNGKETNLWITPPEYTRQPNVHLSGYGAYNKKLDIPEDSKVRVRVHSLLGEWLAPKLYNGNKVSSMNYLGEGLYDIETTIATGTSLSVYQGIIPRASWPYNYIKDQPPEIHRGKKKKQENQDNSSENQEHASYEFLDNAQLRVNLIVKDDYGVKDLQLKMDIDEIVEDRPLGSPAFDTRLVMSEPQKEFKISPIYDMAWHTWAGLPVTFEYTVFDHKGQKATLDKIELVLPERIFEHPMAKSLIAMRKKLAWNYKESFSEIALNLETLLSAPDYFQNDPVIYLAIKTSSARLNYTNSKNEKEKIVAAKEVIKLLWHTAIAIEEGNLSLAMRELRDAQRELENAMRDPNTSEEEISKLMDNLREKMANYFSEMQREIQKRIANGEQFPQIQPENFSQMISPDMLSKMIQEMESALKNGDEQRAQELMSQMQRMMEMMDPSMMPRMPMDMQTMDKGINELQELIERQEKLLGQTQEQARIKIFKNGQTGSPQNMPTIEDMLKEFGIETSPPPSPRNEKSLNSKNQGDTSDEGKSEQEALRYILGQLMLESAEQLDEIPENMGLAEQEMRGSEDALGHSNPEGSIPHQEKAIKHLKEAQKNLSEQLKKRMQQMVGIGPSGGQRYDPLGRPFSGEDQENGNPHGSRVKVPDEAEKKRVDEILRQLRERSGDLNRPDDELDYYRRLLRQF